MVIIKRKMNNGVSLCSLCCELAQFNDLCDLLTCNSVGYFLPCKYRGPSLVSEPMRLHKFYS